MGTATSGRWPKGSSGHGAYRYRKAALTPEQIEWVQAVADGACISWNGALRSTINHAMQSASPTK